MSAVRHRAEGARAELFLESPPVNALSLGVIEHVERALDEIGRSGPRVVVIASGLERAFAAGADLALLAGLDMQGFDDYLARLRRPLERIAGARWISIAAIEGFALGGGLELAAACTLRVVSRAARLGVPEVRLGLLPGAGGTQRLPRLIGRAAALDLLLSGRSVDGAEAARLGLADRLVDPGDALAEARRWADELAAGPAEAQVEIVRCVDAAADLPLASGLELERSAVQRLFGSPDAREGIRAFLEKRRARFGPVA